MANIRREKEKRRMEKWKYIFEKNIPHFYWW
jgi:hypothetical protein